ncbi:MAG: hypothetical protein QG588_526 [Candidatus Poribacteria bacterium]|nr:hypothetical protein [Candidatus Poribacteria bacterium]
MNTLVAILGVIVNIIFALAIIAIIVGLVWVIFPLKDKHYFGSVDVFQYYYPLGGRMTGLSILGVGIFFMILGLYLDKVHFKLSRKFGSRIYR